MYKINGVQVPAYEEKGFWAKVRSSAGAIGEACLMKAFLAYHIAMDSNTPVWVKTALAGSLAYLVSPIDVVPDVIPLLGYSDDATVVGAALTGAAAHIRDEHREKAQASVKNILG